MASLPTGSDKLLEIHSAVVSLVIKRKSGHFAAVPAGECSSTLSVTARSLERLTILGETVSLPGGAAITCHTVSVSPLFFEQTDYELIISSNRAELSFWNENYIIRDRVSPVIDGNHTLLSGIINFGSSVGYSDFDIFADGIKTLSLRIEVYPSKISYKDDYRRMVEDISEMVYGAAIDFMQKTYHEFSINDRQNSIPAIFFQILSMVFDKFTAAARRITAVPHHKLIAHHEVLPEHKAKRTDRQSEKWLLNHPEYVRESSSGFDAERVMSVRKAITFDTTENRFVRFILKSTIQRIQDFIVRYQKSVAHTEDAVLGRAEGMIRSARLILNGTFLNEVSDYSETNSMSLVFGMAPGYRELYKYYLMLRRGLSVHGDVFKISMKDTAQLYEYWCFIKLFSLLKNRYALVSPDIIKTDSSGITISLTKGKKSEAVFVNPRTGELITLVYNPGETKTQTVNQRPDNVLELEKKGTEVSYKYVFDAKYRIESDPSGAYYPDPNPGPKVDDINTMHRYRDSIVYENKLSRFTFEKTMFGAYILFPYDNEELFTRHRFYKSIETVNIGGLPFLPGATGLVQKLLDELISDSKESAFERTTLPRGIEEKLASTDWSRRDVLIGTFRSQEQFDVCFRDSFYYIPARLIPDASLPVHYVALYRTKAKFGASAGIRHYGEVLRMELVRRSDITEIPVNRGNADEMYYRISVRGWDELPKTIQPKEAGFTLQFTNLFLLKHSDFTTELLIESEEKYRFYSELKRSVNSAVINEENANIGFEYGDTRFVFASGKILAIRGDRIIDSRPIDDFARKPSETFRRLQAAIMTE